MRSNLRDRRLLEHRQREDALIHASQLATRRATTAAVKAARDEERTALEATFRQFLDDRDVFIRGNENPFLFHQRKLGRLPGSTASTTTATVSSSSTKGSKKASTVSTVSSTATASTVVSGKYSNSKLVYGAPGIGGGKLSLNDYTGTSSSMFSMGNNIDDEIVSLSRTTYYSGGGSTSASLYFSMLNTNDLSLPVVPPSIGSAPGTITSPLQTTAKQIYEAAHSSSMSFSDMEDDHDNIKSSKSKKVSHTSSSSSSAFVSQLNNKQTPKSTANVSFVDISASPKLKIITKDLPSSTIAKQIPSGANTPSSIQLDRPIIQLDIDGGETITVEEADGGNAYVRLRVGGTLSSNALLANMPSTFVLPHRHKHKRFCKLCQPSILEADIVARHGKEGITRTNTAGSGTDGGPPTPFASAAALRTPSLPEVLRPPFRELSVLHLQGIRYDTPTGKQVYRDDDDDDDDESDGNDGFDDEESVKPNKKSTATKTPVNRTPVSTKTKKTKLSMVSPAVIIGVDGYGEKNNKSNPKYQRLAKLSKELGVAIAVDPGLVGKKGSTAKNRGSKTVVNQENDNDDDDVTDGSDADDEDDPDDENESEVHSNSRRRPSQRGTAASFAGTASISSSSIIGGTQNNNEPDPTLDDQGYDANISWEFWSAYSGCKSTINSHCDSVPQIIRAVQKHNKSLPPSAVPSSVVSLLSSSSSYANPSGNVSGIYTPISTSIGSTSNQSSLGSNNPTPPMAYISLDDNWPFEKWLIRRRMHYGETHGADTLAESPFFPDWISGNPMAAVLIPAIQADRKRLGLPPAPTTIAPAPPSGRGGWRRVQASTGINSASVASTIVAGAVMGSTIGPVTTSSSASVNRGLLSSPLANAYSSKQPASTTGKKGGRGGQQPNSNDGPLSSSFGAIDFSLVPFDPTILGAAIDVQDTGGTWWLAQVVDLQYPEETSTPKASSSSSMSSSSSGTGLKLTTPTKIKIHYQGWPEEHDEWITLPSKPILTAVARPDVAPPPSIRSAVLGCRLAPAMTKSSKTPVISSICAICKNKNSGTIIFCDAESCGKAYHLQCIRPPLSSVPKGLWYCQAHKGSTVTVKKK